MIDSDAAVDGPRAPGSPGHGDASPALSWVLEAVRSAAADTGHPATQQALDAALLALEDALVRLDGRPAPIPGGAS